MLKIATSPFHCFGVIFDAGQFFKLLNIIAFTQAHTRIVASRQHIYYSIRDI